MYRVEILPTAREDMLDIMRYISNELQNPVAADALAVELISEIEGLAALPYSHPSYFPIRSLDHEYRKLLVQNYIVFFWIEEAQRTVTVARVLYGRRNYAKLLD